MVNARGVNGQLGVGQSQQQTKNAFVDMVEKLNIQYSPHKSNVNEIGLSNSRSKNRLKKKRPRNDSNGPSKATPIDTKAVFKRGYTTTEVKIDFEKGHVERPNGKHKTHTENGTKTIEKHDVQAPIHVIQHNKILLQPVNAIGTTQHDMESNDGLNVETTLTLNGERSMGVTQKSDDKIVGTTHDTNMLLN